MYSAQSWAKSDSHWLAPVAAMPRDVRDELIWLNTVVWLFETHDEATRLTVSANARTATRWRTL